MQVATHDARVTMSEIFTADRPLVGMVHLRPLPGSPRWDGDMTAVVERALADATILACEGMDGVIVENYGDAPFLPRAVPPETVASMTRVAAEVVRSVHPLPVGVNVLRNDAAAALAVAAAAGCRFIRVNVHAGALLTDQGWIEGAAHDTLRMRARIGVRVAILADVFVKHAVPAAGLSAAAAARDTWQRGLADALIVSGPRTGGEIEVSRLEEVRGAVAAPVWIGSGLTPQNARRLLPLAHGAIVGSSLQEGGRAGGTIDGGRVRALLAAARRHD